MITDVAVSGDIEGEVGAGKSKDDCHFIYQIDQVFYIP